MYQADAEPTADRTDSRIDIQHGAQIQPYQQQPRRRESDGHQGEQAGAQSHNVSPRAGPAHAPRHRQTHLFHRAQHHLRANHRTHEKSDQNAYRHCQQSAHTIYSSPKVKRFPESADVTLA